MARDFRPPRELPDVLRGVLERQVSEIGDARDRRVADMRRLTRMLDELTGHRGKRRRAFTAAAAIVAVGVVNTLITSNSPVVAFAFLAMAACVGAFSWQVYRSMAREHMRGAWVALVALILSAAMLTGSLVRLAARMAEPAEVSRDGGA